MTSIQTAPHPLQLVVGDEEFLVERAVHDILAAARAGRTAGRAAHATTVSDLTPGRADRVAQSLAVRGAPRRRAAGCGRTPARTSPTPSSATPRIPGDGIVLVVVHSGGGRSKAAKELPAALRKAGAEVTECPKITKPADRETFVRVRGAQGGRQDRRCRGRGAARDGRLGPAGAVLGGQPAGGRHRRRRRRRACGAPLSHAAGPR